MDKVLLAEVMHGRHWLLLKHFTIWGAMSQQCASLD